MSPQTSQKAVPAVAFSHFGFFVRDIDVMEDFFRRVLGFTVTDRGGLGQVRLVFLSRDPNEHHQIVLATGRPEGMAFNPINQISFRVGGIAELRHFFEALKDEPVSEMSPVTHGNAISLYFRDPEGNRIELFMDTGWYCEQPVREPVDFTRSDEEIIARAEQVARSLPNFKPRAQWVEEMRQRMASGQHA
jgi:catechol 2,3-dioxygenase-like lactoylglutathione lyase family enzyme